jgi:hypothetical protein
VQESLLKRLFFPSLQNLKKRNQKKETQPKSEKKTHTNTIQPNKYAKKKPKKRNIKQQCEIREKQKTISEIRNTKQNQIKTTKKKYFHLFIHFQ